jgi:hypothetical protein
MAQNKIFNSEPAFIATNSLTSVQAGGNLFNCAVTTLAAQGIGFAASQPYAVMKHIHLTNTLTTSAVNVTLYKGATVSSVSGTQFQFSSVSIPAQSYLDWYGQHRFDSADYMTGYASLPNAVTINMDGEIGLA